LQYLCFPHCNSVARTHLNIALYVYSLSCFVFVKLDRGPHYKCGRGCIFLIAALHYYCPLIVQPDTRTINVLHVRRKYYRVLSLYVAMIIVLVERWFVCTTFSELHGWYRVEWWDESRIA